MLTAMRKKAVRPSLSKPNTLGLDSSRRLGSKVIVLQALRSTTDRQP